MPNEPNKKLLCLAAAEELRTSPKNTFWQLVVRTLEGDCKVIIWDIPNSNVPNLPRKGDLFSVDFNAKGVRDQRQSEYKNVVATIESIVLIKRESLPEEVVSKLFRVAKAAPEQLQKAYEAITNKDIYKDINHFAFVMACIVAAGKDKFMSHPAGQSVHHAFQGGLAVHTSEVLQISKGIVSTFPFKHLIDQDVVFAGATLHDIGKCYTYENDEIGQPIHNINESIVGHTYRGMACIEKVGVEKNVDQQFLNEVLHVIGSHHGNPEFGAIKEPATIEAMIVSQADYLSSRCGIVETKLVPMKKKKTQLDEEWKERGERFIITKAIKDWYNG